MSVKAVYDVLTKGRVRRAGWGRLAHKFEDRELHFPHCGRTRHGRVYAVIHAGLSCPEVNQPIDFVPNGGADPHARTIGKEIVKGGCRVACRGIQPSNIVARSNVGRNVHAPGRVISVWDLRVWTRRKEN